jgi:hypothetical protein
MLEMRYLDFYILISKQANVSKPAIPALHQNQTGTEIWGTAVIKTTGTNEYWLQNNSLFGWLVADGWCWFVLREEYCWLVAGGWFGLREKYCWLVADKPSEHGVNLFQHWMLQ